jgi:ubiquinone/menaquinone biosynthesis C-methylase UbiE
MPLDNQPRHPFLSLIKETYEIIAEKFSHTRSRVWDDLAIFLKYVRHGDRVLDLGCGNGRLSELFALRHVEYFGVDNSPALIKLANEKYPDKLFIVADALALPLSENYFDVVTSIAIMNHIPAEFQQLYLENILKVLRPGGWFLMTNWNLWNTENKKGIQAFQFDKENLTDEEFLEKYMVVRSQLKENEVITIWNNERPLYYYAFKKDELESLLNAHGFAVEKCFYSKKGAEADLDSGENIITIARKV